MCLDRRRQAETQQLDAVRSGGNRAPSAGLWLATESLLARATMLVGWRMPARTESGVALAVSFLVHPVRQCVCVALVLLASSGCLATFDRVRPTSMGTSSLHSVNKPSDASGSIEQIRLQSPTDAPSKVVTALPSDSELPAPIETPSNVIAAGADEGAVVPPPAPMPGPASTEFMAVPGGGFAPASPEMTQVAAAPPLISRPGVTTAGDGAANPSSGGMSSILRNRMEDAAGPDDDGGFAYPDIDTDPAQLYRERFGVEGEYDPFLFPALMNLIFEDRWLLAEKDPAKALQNQLRQRLKIDIRDPDPDTANFPNGAYTLPKGRVYIETSPVGFYGASVHGRQPRSYQWEYLIRMGLTDNLEFRIFSNGITAQAGHGHQPPITGYSPLAFDFKINFWEENTRYHVPAMGVEIYLQTELLGSTAFNSGTQPSINLLFDQSLPFEIGFEYNFGYTGTQNFLGEIAYQFSYQWSFQREVVKDFDVFVHGFYNAAALPRLGQFQAGAATQVPNVSVMGVGGIWTVSNRLSVFGSYNFGLSPDAPKTIALMGLAVAL